MLKPFKESPLLIKSPVVVDSRGIFSPTPIKFSHKYPLQIRKEWTQTNISVNLYPYTFRGMHFQDPQPQSKLVKVIDGSIIDFLIDLREGGELRFTEYRMEAGDMLYVPKGFAHGFFTLKPLTVVQYLVDDDYRPEFEEAISWESIPQVVESIKANMDSGFKYNVQLSMKDRNAKTLEEYLKQPKKESND
jgi:dTDP-4-dehydrorhamnose 3,5-epimerase